MLWMSDHGGIVGPKVQAIFSIVDLVVGTDNTDLRSRAVRQFLSDDWPTRLVNLAQAEENGVRQMVVRGSS